VLQQKYISHERVEAAGVRRHKTAGKNPIA